MTHIRRIKTVKHPRTALEAQIIIELADGKNYTASKAALDTLATPTAVKAEAEKALGKLDDLFIHKNRDGSWAVATGAAPAVWPEDEPKEIIK